MARRATFFSQQKKTADTFIIGGGFEFFPPGKDSSVKASTIQKLYTAYAAMPYDLFILTQKEQALLETVGVSPDPTWHIVRDTPQLISVTVPDGCLAFILFPDVSAASQKTYTAVANLAAQARASGRYNLIIGIDTLGLPEEKKFLERHIESLDILLSTGPGTSNPGSFLKENCLAWSRPYTRGKNIVSILLPSLPPQGEKIVWAPHRNISIAAEPLVERIYPDPIITKIFRK